MVYIAQPACADFINKLLDRDPKTRMGAPGAGGVKEAKKHPWFHDFDWTALARRRVCGVFKSFISYEGIHMCLNQPYHTRVFTCV